MELNQYISRDSLSKLDFDLQFAVFNSLTPSNKHRIFKEKIDKLYQLYNFSSIELTILEDLYNMDYETFYNNNNQESISNFEDSVKQKLGWDDFKFFVNLSTWMMYYELENLIEGDAWWNNGGSSDDILWNCICRSNFACTFGLNSCVEGKSDCIRKKGCGLFGNLECTGRCSNVDP